MDNNSFTKLKLLFLLADGIFPNKTNIFTITYVPYIYIFEKNGLKNFQYHRFYLIPNGNIYCFFLSFQFH
jgi:hypothetical protein